MPQGYPKVAAFLDSDDNFMLYRRFGYLQSRLLLEKQDDLRRLEEELDRMDRKDAKKDRRNLMTRQDIGEDVFAPRRKLMKDIETNYCEYCAYYTRSTFPLSHRLQQRICWELLKH